MAGAGGAISVLPEEETRTGTAVVVAIQEEASPEDLLLIIVTNIMMVQNEVGFEHKPKNPKNQLLSFLSFSFRFESVRIFLKLNDLGSVSVFVFAK